MKYTERNDIPALIIDAIKDPYYERELGEYLDRIGKKTKGKIISSTTLPMPPRARILRQRYDDEIVVDPVDGCFWKLLGNTVHNILEHHSRPGDIVERRMGMDMDVKIRGRMNKIHLHCKPDIISDGVMLDYKLTSVYAVMRGEKFEHHAQLNVNRFIASKNGIEVKALGNVFLFRDYKPSMVREGSDYPKSHIVQVDVPIWSDEKVIEYITERITLHFESERVSDERLPECTEAERWTNPPIYKAIKIDKDGKPQSKAKFKSESMIELEEWMNHDNNAFERAKDPATKKVMPDVPDISRPIKYHVETVLGKSARCGVWEAAKFCNQRQRELAEMSGGDEDEEG